MLLSRPCKYTAIFPRWISCKWIFGVETTKVSHLQHQAATDDVPKLLFVSLDENCCNWSVLWDSVAKCISSINDLAIVEWRPVVSFRNLAVECRVECQSLSIFPPVFFHTDPRFIVGRLVTLCRPCLLLREVPCLSTVSVTSKRWVLVTVTLGRNPSAHNFCYSKSKSHYMFLPRKTAIIRPCVSTVSSIIYSGYWFRRLFRSSSDRVLFRIKGKLYSLLRVKMYSSFLILDHAWPE